MATLVQIQKQQVKLYVRTWQHDVILLMEETCTTWDVWNPPKKGAHKISTVLRWPALRIYILVRQHALESFPCFAAARFWRSLKQRNKEYFFVALSLTWAVWAAAAKTIAKKAFSWAKIEREISQTEIAARNTLSATSQTCQHHLIKEMEEVKMAQGWSPNGWLYVICMRRPFIFQSNFKILVKCWGFGMLGLESKV